MELVLEARELLASLPVQEAIGQWTASVPKQHGALLFRKRPLRVHFGAHFGGLGAASNVRRHCLRPWATWCFAVSQAPFRMRLLNVFVGDSESTVVEVPYSGSAIIAKSAGNVQWESLPKATSAISMSNLTAAVRRFGLDRGVACGASMQVGPAHHTPILTSHCVSSYGHLRTWRLATWGMGYQAICQVMAIESTGLEIEWDIYTSVYVAIFLLPGRNVSNACGGLKKILDHTGFGNFQSIRPQLLWSFDFWSLQSASRSPCAMSQAKLLQTWRKRPPTTWFLCASQDSEVVKKPGS